jgi:peptidyl-prolyl cis-trans isomerase A (cyclophilin A)
VIGASRSGGAPRGAEADEGADQSESNSLQNRRGTLAMARTNVVDSATAQFFVNLADNDFLNHGSRDFGYAVFGRVVEGMDVVDAIAKVATGRKGGHEAVPTEPVVIESIKRAP